MISGKIFALGKKECKNAMKNVVLSNRSNGSKMVTVKTTTKIHTFLLSLLRKL